MSDEPIVRGVVKWFDLSKGFGFVVADGVPQDILLHVNVVRDSGRTSVMAGDKVELTFEETPKGLQASRLLSLDSPENSQKPGQGAQPQASENLAPARLKWFDKGKGFGFLNVFGEAEDVFLHVDVLRAAGLVEAQVGEAMCVVLTRGAKGASAVAVYPWDIALGWVSQRSEDPKSQDASVQHLHSDPIDTDPQAV